MSQDNQFHQHGYSHYLKAPTKPRPKSAPVPDLRSRLFQKVQTPGFVALSIVGVVALFITVLVASYPSGDDPQTQIPIVKADLRPLKTIPDDRQGMEVPHRDSAILARVGQPAVKGRVEEIENLLAEAEEDVVRKEQAIERSMAQSSEFPEPFESFSLESEEEIDPVVEFAQEEEHARSNDIASGIEQGFDLKGSESPSSADILQKIGSLEVEADQGDVAAEEASAFSEKVASVAILPKPQKPSSMHAPATSPDTIDFVRNILEQKDRRASFEDSAQSGAVGADAAVPSIEPAAGAAIDVTTGVYFVQLASITDRTRAAKEWEKMRARYSTLSGTQFRVQEASLDSGIFYRIQAGPMSKASANEICDALKAAGKPGGCLVVK